MQDQQEELQAPGETAAISMDALSEALKDPATAMEKFGPLIEAGLAFIGTGVAALLVFLVGMFIAGRVRKGVQMVVKSSPRFDETLGAFFGSLAYYGVVAVVLITTLGVFGIPTTSFAAVLGAAGLAIGLSLQGTLGNLAAGVLLLAFRPFQIGHYVQVAGQEGTVKGISLFTTELATVDNKKITIANGEVFDSAIVNFSAYGERRLDLTFGIAYGADIEQAMSIIRSTLDADARARKEPAPTIEVDNLGDSSVDIICRVWCAGSDYFPLKWHLLKTVKLRFDAEGVDIPFPTRTHYVVNKTAD